MRCGKSSSNQAWFNRKELDHILDLPKVNYGYAGGHRHEVDWTRPNLALTRKKVKPELGDAT